MSASIEPIQPAIPGKTIVEPAKVAADQEQRLSLDVLNIACDSGQLYANGMKMLPGGEKTALALRHEWENERTVKEECHDFIDLIKSEQRHDFDHILVKNLWIDRQGVLRGAPVPLILSENAFNQIGSNFQPTDKEVEEARQKGVDLYVPPGLRKNLNLWAPRSKKAIYLRTRDPIETTQGVVRTCFAAVTNRFGVCDLDTIARVVSNTMPEDAHATIVYDKSKGVIEVSLAPTYEIEELGVGRFHRVIVRIEAADDGTGAIKISYKVIRIACINCTTITNQEFVFFRKHIGEEMRLQAMLTEALGKAGEALEAFGKLWREANERSIVDKANGGELAPEEIFSRLVAHGYVKIPWIKPADLVAALMASFQQEPGKSAAHINMAVSRLAHEAAGEFRSPWYVDEMETQAGKLLFQKVYRLPELSDEQLEKLAA